MISDEGISILISSDCNYMELVIEIYYDGKYVALLNQDKGLKDIIIEFPDERHVNKDAIIASLPLNVFEKALEMAKKKLRFNS